MSLIVQTCSTHSHKERGKKVGSRAMWVFGWGQVRHLPPLFTASRHIFVHGESLFIPQPQSEQASRFLGHHNQILHESPPFPTLIFRSSESSSTSIPTHCHHLKNPYKFLWVCLCMHLKGRFFN